MTATGTGLTVINIRSAAAIGESRRSRRKPEK
jgi:hypothetical protein